MERRGVISRISTPIDIGRIEDRDEERGRRKGKRVRSVVRSRKRVEGS